jgi:hypothetical protein
MRPSDPLGCLASCLNNRAPVTALTLLCGLLSLAACGGGTSAGSAPSAGGSASPSPCLVTASQVSGVVGEQVTGPSMNTQMLRPGFTVRACAFSGPTKAAHLYVGQGTQASTFYATEAQLCPSSGMGKVMPVALGDKAFTCQEVTGPRAGQYSALYVLKGTTTVLWCNVLLTATGSDTFEPEQETIAALMLRQS